jgi:hypothetical protein
VKEVVGEVIANSQQQEKQPEQEAPILANNQERENVDKLEPAKPELAVDEKKLVRPRGRGRSRGIGRRVVGSREALNQTPLNQANPVAPVPDGGDTNGEDARIDSGVQSAKDGMSSKQ